MERARKNFPMAIVSLFAILALIFGASEAMAKNAALACPYSPPTNLGECISEMSCDERCHQQIGSDEGSLGTCMANPDGCCTCFL